MELSESHKSLKDRITFKGFEVEASEIQKLYTSLNAGEEKMLPNLKTVGEGKYDFNLRFYKTEEGNVYLNGFTAVDKSDISRQQYFSLGKDKLNITSKEAYNLMEGRSVFKNIRKDENTKMPTWVKLDFSNKNETGQAKYKSFNKSYGFYPERLLAKMGVDLTYKKDFLKSLKKGNEVKTTLMIKGEPKVGVVVADPQNQKIHFSTESGSLLNITSNVNVNTVNYLISNPSKQESFIGSCTKRELEKVNDLVKSWKGDQKKGPENAYESVQLENISKLTFNKLNPQKVSTKEQTVAM